MRIVRSGLLVCLVLIGLSIFMVPTIAAEKKEDWRVFEPPGSFLGSSLTRLGYLAGMLDTLYFIKRSGALGSNIEDCLFDDTGNGRMVIIMNTMASEAVRERRKQGGGDFNVAKVIIERLIYECTHSPAGNPVNR